MNKPDNDPSEIALTWLRSRFPAAFDPRKTLPLKVGDRNYIAAAVANIAEAAL